MARIESSRRELPEKEISVGTDQRELSRFELERVNAKRQRGRIRNLFRFKACGGLTWFVNAGLAQRETSGSGVFLDRKQHDSPFGYV